MRRICSVVLLCSLLISLTACGVKLPKVKNPFKKGSYSSYSLEASAGEEPLVTKDSDLPLEAPHSLLSQMDHLKQLKIKHQALRIPTGIKTIYVVGEQLIIQAYNNKIWALDAKTLVVDWTWSGIVGELDWAPCGNGFAVYFVARDRLYAIDKNEGFERWRFDLPFAASSAPAVHETYIFMGSWDGRIYCLSDDIRSASIAWYDTLGSPIIATPMVAEILKNTWVHVSAEDGQYNKYLPNRTRSAPYAKTYSFEAGSIGPLAHDSERAYVASPDYNIYAVDPILGPQWVYMSESRCEEGVVLQDDILYVRNEQNMLALDSKTGKELWKNTLLKKFIVKLKRFSYFETIDGQMVGVDNQNIHKKCEVKWTSGFGVFTHALRMADSPILFLASKEGYIISYEEKY